MKTKSPLFLAVLLLTLAATLGRGAERMLSGPEIYERMLGTYERAQSYEDTGEVRTRFVKRFWPDRTTLLPFTTAFVRPDAFRFEFRSRAGGLGEGQRYLIWRSGDEVKSWWSIQPGIRINQPFELAIAAATGVSGGSSARIAALLLPDLQWGRRMRFLEEIQLSGQEELEGAACYHLRANGPDGRPVEFWVDARTFLLRQLFETRQLDGFRTETTTIYHSPRVNASVAPEKLRFDPGESQPPIRTKLTLPSANLLPFAFLALLAVGNALHWRLRPGSRWSYAPGLRAVAIFSSLAIGALVALILAQARGDQVLIAICLYGTLVLAYTGWRRERSLLTEKARPRTARP